ncbi:MAG TPA: GMC family oxidoreductase [Baekduia sp.]|nr:GMC family oxidoreductase [Baekduia sp.]
MTTSVPLPAETDVIVVGGGSAGCAVAARLAEGGRDVLLLEAGPDPGPLGDPRWPADLLDARSMGTSCDWGFDSGDTYPDQVVGFERARILGGCSTHNSAVQTWGHAADYDAWARVGGPDWSAAALRPLFERASAQQQVRTYALGELTPFQQAWHAAGPGAGLPHLDHLNNLDETVGVGPESVSIVDGVRFNGAFAYLDPLREDPRLTIAGDALVDRLLLDGTRAAGVVVLRGGETVEVRSTLVVLCGGTYCSPAVLLRSGIGPAADLRALGIPVVADRPGVGANLHDQPFVLMSWEGSAELAHAMVAHAAGGWTPEEQVMAKAASSHDPGVFDLHVMPYSPTRPEKPFGRGWHAGVGALTPRSRGAVTLASRDPEVLPRVDHAFLTDPEGHDLAVLIEGIALARELAAQPALRDLLGAETAPGPAGITDPGALRAHLLSNIDNYWHPVGTCAMGAASDPAAVVDGGGAVHGVEGVLVGDCALMPAIPRATTAMPAVVVGERIAASVLA